MSLLLCDGPTSDMKVNVCFKVLCGLYLEIRKDCLLWNLKLLCYHSSARKIVTGWKEGKDGSCFTYIYATLVDLLFNLQIKQHKTMSCCYWIVCILHIRPLSNTETYYKLTTNYINTYY